MKQETELSFSPEEYEKIFLPGCAPEQILLPIACNRIPAFLKETTTLRIMKKSIDARRRNQIRVIFRVQLVQSEEDSPFVFETERAPAILSAKQPVIVGFGPAGMMAALYLARNGVPPIILERGTSVERRITDVESYSQTGIVHPSSNVQFGEGGAGTFSDGKLNSGIKDKRKDYVLHSFVKAGAPDEILYLNRPHVGTDRIRSMVREIRSEIESLGGTFLFSREFCGLEKDGDKISAVYHRASTGANGIASSDRTKLECDDLILAVGHSARDTFRFLSQEGIHMEAKPLSVGVRIEHEQSWLNAIQYGDSAALGVLPAAEYKLVSHTSTGRALYTFCMCPGGFVVPSASAPGQIVTNGMSNYRRDEVNCNSALLVGVTPSDYKDDSALAGLDYLDELEHAAFRLGGSNGRAPCQRVADFLLDRASSSCGTVLPTYKPGVTFANLKTILPAYVSDTIAEGILSMNQSLPGFSTPDAIMTGLETRSSSPVRIERGENLQSVSLAGFFPTGEGAGYAGGILSSAVDGLRCAEAVLARQ